MSGYNLADLFEIVVDADPSREALVAPARRLTLAALDERANRLAHVLRGLGIQAGQHVGLQMVNGTEYLEGMLACFKVSAVPVNVNFRYVEAELRQLYDDADLVAVLHHRQFSARVAAVAHETPSIRSLLVVEDGTADAAPPQALEYETALAQASSERPHNPERSGDDRYIAYTGGTTGMPKGVVWRQEDLFFAALGGGDPTATGDVVSSPEELATRLPAVGATMLVLPPLMHVSAQWSALLTIFTGGRVVFPPPGHVDPDVVLQLMADEHVNIIAIVGDAMARPLVTAMERAAANGRPYDLSALLAIGSGGATLSPEAKSRLQNILPTTMILDGLGASETGILGTRPHQPGEASSRPRFTVNAETQVFDDDGRPVPPGSGRVGRLARKGHVPLGYYKDVEKTRATFLDIRGERWVLPGDCATVDADGAVVLLGRGSTSINTGGEKVYPEEVEVALWSAPEVADAVVVGVPDERWGERVVAIVQPAPGTNPSLRDLQERLRTQLAGYKVPRALLVVDTVERTPAGKPDYAWARALAKESGPALDGPATGPVASAD